MITWEYPTVLKGSKDRAALEKMHDVNISEDFAIEVVYAYLDEDEVSVRFTGYTGRGSAHGGKRGAIMLPAEKCGKLTWGITLHEIAHVIMHNDKKKRGHGVEFIEILDDLVYSENNWRHVA